MTPGASLWIVGTGLLIQMLSYPLVLVFAVSLQELPLGQVIMFVLMLVWLFLPLLGLFGIIVGVKCYLRRIGAFLPFLGIVMNTLWLVAFAVACYLVFIERIPV